MSIAAITALAVLIALIAMAACIHFPLKLGVRALETTENP